MADQFDRASDLEMLNLQSSLNLHKTQAALQKKIEATGLCLYCGEDLPEGVRWCNAECRDEWEAEQ